MNLFQIILFIVIIVIIVLFIYAYFYNKITTQMLKINAAESEIDSSLRYKYDLLVSLVNEILQADKDNKDFKNIDDLKDINVSSFEFERRLVDIESKIESIKNENSKLLKSSSFNNNLHEIYNINTKIRADEKYYNEKTTIYNNLVSKFPSNIVSRFMKLKEKKYFDGKDMYDKNTKDFKI